MFAAGRLDAHLAEQQIGGVALVAVGAHDRAEAGHVEGAFALGVEPVGCRVALGGDARRVLADIGPVVSDGIHQLHAGDVEAHVAVEHLFVDGHVELVIVRQRVTAFDQRLDRIGHR